MRVRFSACTKPYDSAEELIASVRGDRLLEITAARSDHDRRHPCFDSAVGGTFDRHGEYATWRFQERVHTALARRALATELHAKHSVCWTVGEPPDHNMVLVDPDLLWRSRRSPASRGMRPGSSTDATRACGRDRGTTTNERPVVGNNPATRRNKERVHHEDPARNDHD